MEHEGYQFESADASFEMMVLNVLGRFKPHFKLNMYKTSGEWPNPDGTMSAYAVLIIDVNGKTETAASTGNYSSTPLTWHCAKPLPSFTLSSAASN